MGLTVTEKIIKDHLISGEMEAGEEIGISIDQTLTQDATGTVAWLQFEALDIPEVQVKRAVSYVDHNTLQSGFRNADDHRYLKSAAKKYGAYFSRPGNGICHQVNLEQFAVPGWTLLGSDSHTPTSGGVGTLSIGAGGLDVAVAMGGGPYYLNMPEIVKVHLKGELQPWVSSKDVILEILRRLGVKGGLGKVMEYGGPGIDRLSVYDRATITNMGAELGATTSIFPSDEKTERFLKMLGREDDYTELKADGDADYDDVLEVDMSEIEPMIAKPHSPGNVVKIDEVTGLDVDQVCVGSCTNSSYKDLMTVAKVLKGQTVSEDLDMTVSPGSKQIYETITRKEATADLIGAGARILEAACGPCIGMGQSPPSGGVSLRTFNRNFKGRSGTEDADIYLCSPEVAAATALNGVLTDPRELGEPVEIEDPDNFAVNTNMIIDPPEDSSDVEIYKGPNIKDVPLKDPLPDTVESEILLKVEDDITTDHIMPAGADILPYRSNIPKISEFVFEQVDEGFSERANNAEGGFILGGENYGQGSSREHAALAPMHLGVQGVIAKSLSRIHWNNLINFGILPLILEDKSDYEKIKQGDRVRIEGLRDAIESDSNTIEIKNLTEDSTFNITLPLSSRQKEIIKAGGLLAYTKEKHDER